MARIAEEMTDRHATGPRLFRRLFSAFLLAFASLSIAAPFVNATRFSASIQRALEESLGRRVRFDGVYYRLLPAPGFSLENVTIGEDPRFGLEPFSYMSGLEARLRIDKLLLGHIRFASLRLIDPSLNIVKRDDGAWNVVELVERMSAPRSLPLTLIPAIQVSNARFDFKLGVRKTNFYIAGADVSIYPERSGRVVLSFSGSPARTDRAGNGFGSLRGSLNWLVAPGSSPGNQLEADVVLEPSNLSELTTLIEGQDAGVHGTISSRARIAGPLANLKVTGDLRLQDVHRWDLLPSSGDDWRVPYGGSVDLISHRLELRTLPPHDTDPAPAALEVRVNNFLTQPAWTLMTSLHQAPIESLLPLARRMGFGVPAGVALSGAIDGAIGYSNTSGLAGEISLNNAVAKLPGIEPISAAAASVKILPDSLHLEPATLQATGGGALRVSGDYSWVKQHSAAAIAVDGVSIQTLKNTAQAWFGAPAALAAFSDGVVSGELKYDNAAAAGWSGEFQFSGATIAAGGVAAPLKHAEGRVVFNPANFEMARFSATLGAREFEGSYRYNLAAKRQERLRLELAAADLLELAAALEPAWQDQGLLARLPFTNRAIPDWLAARNLEGDLTVGHLLLNQNELGPFAAHFVWQGVNLQINAAELRLAEASLKASGTVNLAARAPKTRLAGSLSGYRWGGGTVDADGEIESSGAGLDAIRALRAAGKFRGSDLSLSSNENFERVSGLFALSFAEGWPNLRLTKVQAVQQNDDWSGAAASNSDGQLVFDLGNGDRQLHIVSTLAPAPAGLPRASQAVAQK